MIRSEKLYAYRPVAGPVPCVGVGFTADGKQIAAVVSGGLDEFRRDIVDAVGDDVVEVIGADALRRCVESGEITGVGFAGDSAVFDFPVMRRVWYMCPARRADELITGLDALNSAEWPDVGHITAGWWVGGVCMWGAEWRTDQTCVGLVVCGLAVGRRVVLARG